jgi:hypothetical protein
VDFENERVVVALSLLHDAVKIFKNLKVVFRGRFLWSSRSRAEHRDFAYPNGSVMSSQFSKSFWRYGVPFLVLVVGGSFGLKEFTTVR